MKKTRLLAGARSIALALAGIAAVAAMTVHATTFAYIPNQGNGSVSVIDTSTQTQVSVIPAIGTTYSAAVAPNGSVAYAANFSGNRIVPINTTTNAAGAAIIVGANPVNVTFSSDSSKAYVSNYGANSISVVDVVGGVVSATVSTVCPVGAANPLQSVFNGAKLLIVCNGGVSKIVSMDTASGNALTALATVGNTAYNIAISTASGFGFVSNYGGASISKFDLSTGATTNYPTTGINSPLGLAVTPDGSKIYVADYAGNNLIVMGPTGTVNTTLNLGGSSAGIGMSSNGSVIYVPRRGLGAGIKVINTATDALTGTIANPGADAEVIWGDFLGNVAALATPNQAPTATGVTTSGSALVGALLTGSYVYSDPDSDPQGVSTFKWYSDSASSGATKVAIGGATSLTYTVQAADVGKFLFFCVTPIATTGTLTGVETCSTASSAVVANQAPTVSNVAIIGVATVGVQLTSSYTYADAESNPQGASTFKWYSDTSGSGATKVAISGATAMIYTVQASDLARFLFFCVTPVATAGSLTGVETCSAATAAVGSAVTTYTGASATGSGIITATLAGGGAACGYTASQFIPVTGNAASPPVVPPGVSFPQGLFDFITSGCTPGSTITLTITYPQLLPSGTQYMKYGPTPTDSSNHWYVVPATIVGNTVTFSITDGGLGDDDLAANGTIVDQGGPAVPDPPSAAAIIPTLSEWGVAILASLLALSSLVVLRRRGL